MWGAFLRTEASKNTQEELAMDREGVIEVAPTSHDVSEGARE